ncbi:hypothetical protein LCGC14_0677150 [marine sediment metagenome]|uniref:Uncharacterized protein n=1 Tax=marine sediment metagenome TaxID=412755 RepID=A0A0F9TAP2_9ZZZZ
MKDKEAPDFTIEKAPRIPFWQVLHNDLTKDLKKEKYIKHVYRHTVAEVNDVIKSGKIWCDDCGKEIELKLPKNYEELESFALRFINRNCVHPCDECIEKDIDAGRVIGSEKGGWGASKKELKKELLGK